MMRDTAHAEVAPNAEQNNFCLLNKVCVVFIFSISSFGSILSGEVICCNTAVGDAQGNSKVEEVKKMSMSHPEDLGQDLRKPGPTSARRRAGPCWWRGTVTCI